MNLKVDLTKKNQELLEEIGVKIENKEYTSEEIKRCEDSIANHIFSKSSKNGDIAKETIKYNDLMRILVNNEK